MIAIVIILSLLTVFTTTDVEAIGIVLYTTANAGNSVTVQCPLRLSSCPGIPWHKISASGTSVTITSSAKYTFTNYCGLVIKDLNEADAVYYQCTISGQKRGVYLFVFQSQPSCSVTAPGTSGTVAEDDQIQYECIAAIYGIGQTRVTWYGKMTEGVPNDQSMGYNIHGTLSTVAKAPTVQTMACHASFHSTAAVVSMKLCETVELDILYSVRNVRTSPKGFARPGQELSCYSDANPKAYFRWMVKEENATEWSYASELNEKLVAELHNGTSSAQYKCVASNAFRGIAYKSESPEVEVSLTNHGSAIRTPIIMTVSIVALLVIDGIVFGKWSH